MERWQGEGRWEMYDAVEKSLLYQSMFDNFSISH